MKAFRFSELALDDVRQIAEYTRQHWGLRQTAHYIDTLVDTCDQLAWFPGMGIRVVFRSRECRYFLAGEHKIIYRQINDDLIEIARIVHTRTDRSE